ncbi:PfkB family carbohydrate kinase [Neobacillus cucumis]|uniref:PfkB family carbohydrate kinase n=1 Tax=Neobacillus cucumis TaxID=1740721 RepID=UPI00203E16E4|nr:PfkB family carbohydrate kinase [Neobacillus cucumis]MCM3728979.1 PfkB family carbohydrate kinase [Neobacillus cucumis]
MSARRYIFIEKSIKIVTTSARDTFIGAFVVESSLSHSIQDGLRYAATAAALSVIVKGAQSSSPTRKRF